MHVPCDPTVSLLGVHPKKTKIKYIYTVKKKEILPFVTTWMDLEGIMLSEMSQTILYDLTHMWTLKNN